MERLEVHGVRPEEVWKEIERAVETAMIRRSGDLQALRSAVLAAQGILDAEGVGGLLGVSARTVTERYVPQGLKVYRPGKAPMFLIEDVKEFIRSHGAEPLKQ